MEQSFGCPSEEYEKEEGTLPHDFTTGKWRVHLIYPGERYGLDGCLTYELNAYSGAPAAVHRASYPLVEFYDTSQDAARFPGGQFVSRYYMTDLLEDNSIAVSIDTMLKNGNPFSLDGGIPAWTVEGDDLAKVNDFLKKSCMEFCGSLPGDDRGGGRLLPFGGSKGCCHLPQWFEREPEIRCGDDSGMFRFHREQRRCHLA